MLAVNRIKLIQVARKALRLSDDDYHAILQRVGQVNSTRDLDNLGFHHLMAEFQRLGFRSTWRKKTGGYRPGMATPAQIALMGKLWQDYRGEEDEAGFRAWLERFHRISDPRFATAEAGKSILTGLRAMAKRKQAA